ncbi:MATE family efflux transporter [Pelomonas sp. SE-A7]|uniref:MATE family efflux transporter n=1 Tax=Pelomonas sp. SE-A7 TaxID=3054953 RepID=UPI00259D10C6|nr:MATE family efflux transporter [Pelomonas sp. SE-A7]MDM4765469.1 MATE family efflux transporter [Pelomonas sp. SE-A7]
MSSPFRHSLSRILPLAWPVFIGQLAVLAFSTIDTVLVGRYSATDLASLAVGAAVYMTVFVGLMGVVLAVMPLSGQHFGAGRLREAGDELHQAVWTALMLSLPGLAVLLMPDPFLWIARTSPEVETKIRHYLLALAPALPAALVFTAYRGFNTAVSRPKMVMLLQLAALLLKLPLTALLIHGHGDWLPALGVVGCGIATSVVMWIQVAVTLGITRRDPFYAKFGLHEGRGLHRPRWAAMCELLKLGVPMGCSIVIEVSGFTFMAIFIARLGATAVAGHQLAMNLVSLLFMMPLALANASSTLVAQRIGARDPADAARLGWHGLITAVLLAAVNGGLLALGRQSVLGLYTNDAAVVAAAMPLLVWLWFFHTADAAQTVAAFVLRSYRIATAPMVVYALAIWGVGMAGGYWLAFSRPVEALAGAQGFWAAATVGLVVAAAGMTAVLAWVHRQEAAESARA